LRASGGGALARFGFVLVLVFLLFASPWRFPFPAVWNVLLRGCSLRAVPFPNNNRATHKNFRRAPVCRFCSLKKVFLVVASWWCGLNSRPPCSLLSPGLLLTEQSVLCGQKGSTSLQARPGEPQRCPHQLLILAPAAAHRCPRSNTTLSCTQQHCVLMRAATPLMPSATPRSHARRSTAVSCPQQHIAAGLAGPHNLVAFQSFPENLAP